MKIKSLFKNKCKIILWLIIVAALVLILNNIGKHYKFSYNKGLNANSEYLDSLPEPEIEFIYASMQDTNLIFLRNKYNLDSIAGSGSELDRIINLMLWVHKLSPHAANPTWPTTVNSLNIIDLCQNENKAINCYMYSVVLNEVYLSMGFHSRFIHLRYIVPGESHVVNAVFSKSLDKWIMMDANHGAYFMDQDRNILSLPEIREKIINKDEIIFNDELEYIGSVAASKIVGGLIGIEKFYRWYFSKNIFKYETNVENVFDVRSDRTSDLIQLVPSNYSSQLGLNKRNRKYERFHRYYTDDEEFFWQSPPISK